jgi:hypothetical protein
MQRQGITICKNSPCCEIILHGKIRSHQWLSEREKSTKLKQSAQDFLFRSDKFNNIIPPLVGDLYCACPSLSGKQADITSPYKNI